MPRVHLVNPSTKSFGVAVITPRWLYVLASATGTRWGDPRIVDETLDPLDLGTIASGDVVGIGIHTGNARRGYEIGREARQRGAWVVYGGIHATLFPDEAAAHGMAHAVVRGDGDLVWPSVVEDCLAGAPRAVYEGGRIAGDQFASARWDLLPRGRYMWASVQTVRGCPKHCSFCSVWRTDGQEPRQRGVDRVIREIVELRRLGFRFIALADDNFYPVTLTDLAQAKRRANGSRLRELEALRAERFELMTRLAELPDDLVLYTQITMEAAEDPTFLDAMRRAKIRGALVGVESVSVEGLKDVYRGSIWPARNSWRACGPFASTVSTCWGRSFWPPQRYQGEFRRHRCARATRRLDVRAIRPPHTLPRYGRLRQVGGRRETARHPGRRCAAHATLAHT